MKPDNYVQLARSVEQNEPIANSVIARALRDASQERRELEYYRRKYALLDKHSFLWITIIRKNKTLGYFHSGIIEDERDTVHTANMLRQYQDALNKSIDDNPEVSAIDTDKELN